MLSYKAQLAKIGYAPGQTVSYKSFFLASQSFAATLRSMDFPSKFWEAIPGDELDKNWTEEVQGCAFAFDSWFHVSNASDHKTLYVFDGASGQQKSKWNLKAVPPAPFPGFAFNHFGAIIIIGSRLYVDHFCDIGGQILVLGYDGATVSFSHWIKLDNVPEVGGRVGMIAITNDEQRIITSGGNLNIDRVCLHDIGGSYLGKQMVLNPPITDGGYAQGGFWSPNNHLFISSGEGSFWDSAKGHQYIYCYSPLNGLRLGIVPVTSLAGRQELEGCCYADVTRNGLNVQIHAVLLENEYGAKDDIYLKSFTADAPDLI